MLARKKPEEAVRQRLLFQMIEELGYPRSLIAVEKELKSFGVDGGIIPKRRVDLLCFHRSLAPLLLIECKAERIDEKSILQVLGYNAVVKAPFLALARPGAILFISQKDPTSGSTWHTRLPRFDELVHLAQESS